MAVNGVKAQYQILQSIAFGDIPETNYLQIGTNFTEATRIIIIINGTNEPIFVSFNGVDDNSWILPNHERQINYGANANSAVGLFEQPALTGVWVHYDTVAPTSGAVYIESIYATN